jgi:hypothetical protein
LSAQARAAEILFLRLTDVDRAQLLPDGAACATFGGTQIILDGPLLRFLRALVAAHRPGVVVPARALMPGPDVLRAIADHDPAVEQLVEPAATETGDLTACRWCRSLFEGGGDACDACRDHEHGASSVGLP